MDFRLRNAIVICLSCVLACIVGINVADENYMLGTLVLAAAIWLVLGWLGKARIEAYLIAVLIVGYLVGNRGFAQIAPIAGLPLFVGEISLGFALCLLIFRGSYSRNIPIQRDGLNYLLLYWLALALGRVGSDFRAFGFMALRDFAMVYYLLFFFCVQALAPHRPSSTVLEKALTVSGGILPLTVLGTQFFSDVFLRKLVFNSVPLILQKGDLLAMGLFSSFLWLLPMRSDSQGDAPWRWLGAIANLSLGFLQLSRASMLGLLVAMGWLALARRWQHLAVTVAVCLTGAAGVTAYSLMQGRGITDTKVYAVYEAALSVADFSGTHSYRSEMSSNKGDNNRFRLVWWRNVVEETVAANPWLGLGFGADLARGFLREYYSGEDLEFTARSPHNIFITTFGRMGLIGAAVLMAIYITIARDTWRLCRQIRQADGTPSETTLRLHAVAWLMMIGACFGVVLEGPMGAIPFWSILAMARDKTDRLDSGAPNEKRKLPTSQPDSIATLHAETKGV